MKRTRSRLGLDRETIRSLSAIPLDRVVGAVPALTDGNNGCHSEATGCPTVTEWSCVWGSCTAPSGDTGQ